MFLGQDQLFEASLEYSLVLSALLQSLSYIIPSVEKIVPVLSEILVLFLKLLEFGTSGVPLSLTHHLVSFTLDVFCQFGNILVQQIID